MEPLLILALVIAASFTFCMLWLLIAQDSDFTLLFYKIFRPNLKSFQGKVIWLVGSSSGIGEQMAYHLAKCRCKLIVTGTSYNKLLEVKSNCIAISKGELTEADILVASFDVSDANARQFHFHQVINAFGNVDILVNNAGRTHVAPFEQDSQIEALFQANFFGQMELSRMILSHWSKLEYAGQIALTSSLLNYYRLPFIHTYSATKRALHGFYESLRYEYYSKGIKFTICVPGPVSTEIYLKSAIKGEKKNGFQSCMDMKAKRCAKLMLVSIANQLSESWITRQPLLYLTYLITSFPTIDTVVLKLLNPYFVKKARENFF